MQWKEVEVQSLLELLRINEIQFEQVMKNPRLILQLYPGGCDASGSLLENRLAIQQDLLTRLKHRNLNKGKISCDLCTYFSMMAGFN